MSSETRNDDSGKTPPSGIAQDLARDGITQITGYIAGEVRTVEIKNEQEAAQVFQMIIDSSVESALGVDLEPVMTMTRWRYVRVRRPDGLRTRHLVGWSEYEGRVCSAIVSIDPLKKSLITQSGRVYQLDGEPGHDRDAAWVFSRWLKVLGASENDVSEQTKALTRVFEKAAEKAKAGKPASLIHARSS